MESIDTRQLAGRARQITQRELGEYIKRTAGSMKATERARKVMPMGVPSSFQAYDPHPIVVRKAHSSWMEDVDGNRYIDFDMGFGALFSGHCNPIVRRAVDRQLDDGTLFVTPCELNSDVAERCSPLDTTSRCGGSPTVAPKRRWTPSASPVA
jgi:glutamate-1-semialdehyde 2,1-aminomutase